MRGWFRITSANVLAACGATLGTGSLTILLVWTAGRFASDRWPWSQLLSWIPSVAALTIGGVGLAAGTLIARSRWTRVRMAALALGWALLLGGAAWSGLVEWRLLASRDESPGEGAPALCVAFWNVSGAEPPDWVERFTRETPDLAVFANPRGYQNRLPEFQRAIAGGGGAFHYQQRWCVSSRLPIERWGAIDLGIGGGRSVDPRRLGEEPRFPDTGRAMFIELRTGETWGRNAVVWLIDLPSDLGLSRMDVARRTAAALAEQEVQTFTADAAGRWTPTGHAARFPPPDLIVGDFNIPRGAASLRELIPVGARDAYAEAGVGYAATYPASFPLWALDQAYVGSAARATEFRVVNAGGGTHRMIVVEAAPR